MTFIWLGAGNDLTSRLVSMSFDNANPCVVPTWPLVTPDGDGNRERLIAPSVADVDCGWRDSGPCLV